MPELKPCPFCGSAILPEVFSIPVSDEGDVLEYYVECMRCQAMMGFPYRWSNSEDSLMQYAGFETPEEAAEAWNRRANE